MLSMHLVLHRLSESVICLKLPWVFRTIFAAITAMLLASMISLGSGGVVPVMITAVTLFAALYEERWTFDSRTRSVVHRYGLVIFAKTRAVKFDDIESFVLSNYHDPRDEGTLSPKRVVISRSLVSFQMAMKEGKNRTIEIRANRHNNSMKQNAETIADFCGLPIEYSR
jgi:hypothetical protein